MRTSCVPWLEVELRGQLDLSWRGVAAQSRSQYAGGRGYRLNDMPELRAGNVAYWLVEVGVIQNVKEASAKDELLTLTPEMHFRSFHNGQIGSKKAGAPELSSSLRTETGRSRREIGRN